MCKNKLIISIIFESFIYHQHLILLVYPKQFNKLGIYFQGVFSFGIISNGLTPTYKWYDINMIDSFLPHSIKFNQLDIYNVGVFIFNKKDIQSIKQ